MRGMGRNIAPWDLPRSNQLGVLLHANKNVSNKKGEQFELARLLTHKQGVFLSAILLFLCTSVLFLNYRSIADVSSNTVAGINYLSAGNSFSESSTTLNTDFARFQRDGIKHISVRIVWSVLEPTYNSLTCRLDSAVLSNYKRVLTIAQKFGISVNLDFWTHFQDVQWDMPEYIQSVFDIVRNSTARRLWLRYVSAVVTELKDYPSVESWAILNEPFYTYSADKLPMQQLFVVETATIKSIDNTHPIICRFALSCTPASGDYDSSVYDVFDAFAVTEYLDPSNPYDTSNGRWSYWDKTVSDCKARDKPLWVIEFGDDSTNLERVRLHYQLSLAKFQAAGVARAYAWAWQTRSASSEAFNIYSGGTPDPAYYELAKYPEKATSCDFNQDGRVDMRDVIAVVSHVFTTSASPNWDQKYDLNLDGSVDMRDVVIVMGYFGTNVG